MSSDLATYLDALPESRAARIRHYMEIIESAVPDAQPVLWPIGDGIIGYGHYHYRYASGRTGEFFVIGLGNRKRYIALYANAADGGRYLAESFADRLPGCSIGKSCIEVPDKASIDDEVLANLARRAFELFRAKMDEPMVPGTLHIWE
jgi:hypothetical protein